MHERRNQSQISRSGGEASRERRRLTILHVYSSEGEVDDRRVLLLDKVVLGEPLGVQDQVRGQPSDLVTLEGVAKFLKEKNEDEASQLMIGTRERGRLMRRDADLGCRSVVLCENGREGDLGDDVLLDRVLEERRTRQVECEEEERRLDRLDVCGTRKRERRQRSGRHSSRFEPSRRPAVKRTSTDVKLGAGVSSRVSLDDNLLSLHLEVSLEGLVDDA